MTDLTSDVAGSLVGTLGSWLSGTGITRLELRTPTESLRLLRSGDGAQASPTTISSVQGPAAPAISASIAAAAPSRPIAVTAPLAGVFLDRHPMQAEGLALPGQSVRAGDVVGLVRVGSLLMHVLASVDGIVAEVIATPGCVVGYGAELLHLAQGNGK